MKEPLSRAQVIVTIEPHSRVSLSQYDWTQTEDLITALRAQLAQVTAERDEAIKERKRSAEKWMDDLLAVQQQLAEARAEIAVDDKLLAERNRILDALPCPTHGPCVPHVLQWIAEAQMQIKELEAISYGTPPAPPVAESLH